MENEELGNGLATLQSIVIVFGIVIILIFIVAIFSGSKTSVNGCYYISDHILSNTTNTPALCFDGKKVTFKINGEEKEYKLEQSNDLLLVEDIYDSLKFRCTVSDNDSKSIKCLSLSKDIGNTSNVWNKK